MKMQMKYRLLARVSACEKEGFPLRAKDLPLPSRDCRAKLKHRRQFLGSRIEEVHGMPFGNYERMPFSEWTDGQESNTQVVLAYKRCGRTGRRSRRRCKLRFSLLSEMRAFLQFSSCG